MNQPKFGALELMQRIIVQYTSSPTHVSLRLQSVPVDPRQARTEMYGAHYGMEIWNGADVKHLTR